MKAPARITIGKVSSRHMVLARSGVTIFFATLPGIAENRRGGTADSEHGAASLRVVGFCLGRYRDLDEKGSEGDVVQRATTPGNKTSSTPFALECPFPLVLVTSFYTSSTPRFSFLPSSLILLKVFIRRTSRPFVIMGTSQAEDSFEFINTPPAPTPLPASSECGVKTTSVRISINCYPSQLREYQQFTDNNEQYASIPNAPLPADGPGNDSFSNITVFGVLFAVPFYLRYKVGGGWKTFIFFTLLTAAPILIGYWTIKSRFSPRRNEKVKLPGKPIETYLEFHKKEDALQYKGKAKIPMETFHEMYFEGDVSFKGDCLEVMEYRHDWASFEFTLSLFKFFITGMIPEMLIHSRSQGVYSFFYPNQSF